MDVIRNKTTDSVTEMWSESIGGQRSEAGPQWLQQLKTRAGEAFLLNGLPGNKDEAWKYTSLRPLETLRPSIANTGPDPSGSEPHETQTEQADFGFSFINGHIRLSNQPAPEGVSLRTLQSVFSDPDSETLQQLKPILQKISVDQRSQAFEAINTALLENGVVIKVAAGVDAGTCLSHWQNDHASEAFLWQSRVIIILEKGAKCRFIERFDMHEALSSTEPSSSVGQASNLLLQVQLDEDAGFEHIRLQNTGKHDLLLTYCEVTQDKGSLYRYSGFDTGGELVRHNLICQLLGEEARAEINGAFILNRQQHVDNHILVEHKAIGTTSDQFFRGVLSDRSRAVFNGKAVIRPGADGSSIRQSNANLLLSDLAEIDTKPELEIYADEVEASHGATVGQLDQKAIFYLRTRGLSEHEARSMLVAAFCRSVSDRMEDRVLATQINEQLDAALPAIGDDTVESNSHE